MSKCDILVLFQIPHVMSGVGYFFVALRVPSRDVTELVCTK